MQSRMKLTAVKLAALVFLAGAFALPVLPHAAAAAESQATYKVENLNDSELKMTFNHADVHIDAKGCQNSLLFEEYLPSYLAIWLKSYLTDQQLSYLCLHLFQPQ